jgi:hypothetical protein
LSLAVTFLWLARSAFAAFALIFFLTIVPFFFF